MLVAGWVACLGVAHADFVVETPPLDTREAAEAALAQAETDLPASAKAGVSLRVVRRYVRGLGWRYFVAAEGIPGQRQGAVLAAALQVDGQPARMFEEEAAAERTPVAVTPSPASAEAKRSDKARAKSAAMVLRAAIKAHGGQTEDRARLEAADSLSFTFVRTLPQAGPLVARHAYTRSGDAVRLDVVITSGDGKGSSAAIDAEGAGWIQEEGGAVEPRNADRLVEILDRFSPLEVLSAGIDLGHEIATGAAWLNLERVGEAGGAVVRLRPSDPVPQGGLVEAVFDAQTHLLREASWRRGGSVVTYRYEAFEALGDGLVIPRRMTVARGDRDLEEIEVQGLTLGEKIPQSRFAAPK